MYSNGHHAMYVDHTTMGGSTEYIKLMGLNNIEEREDNEREKRSEKYFPNRKCIIIFYLPPGLVVGFYNKMHTWTLP